jgi:protein SCO1/2
MLWPAAGADELPPPAGQDDKPACCAGHENAAPTEEATPTPPEAPAAHETLGAGAAVEGLSLYQLELPLTDQDGRDIGLDTWSGHPVIITMLYATCPYACPLLIADIRRLEAALDAETLARTRVLLVSFDPERDSVAALKELADRHGVDQTRWRFARGDAAKVRELAAVLGIRYRFLKGGVINHSSILTVLDRSGLVTHRTDGLRQPVEPAAAALREVATEGD